MGLVLQAKSRAVKEREARADQLRQVAELKEELMAPRRMMLSLVGVQDNVETRAETDLASARAAEATLASAISQARRLQALLRQASTLSAAYESSTAILEDGDDMAVLVQARLSAAQAMRRSAEKRLRHFSSSSRRMLEALVMLDFTGCVQWLREKETSAGDEVGKLNQLVSALAG